jgi:hypothetical protein
MSRSRVEDGMKVSWRVIAVEWSFSHGYNTHLLLARFAR